MRWASQTGSRRRTCSQTGSDAATIERWLRQRTPKGRLMIVGHNPTFSDLVSLLVVGAEAADLRAEERRNRRPHCAGGIVGPLRALPGWRRRDSCDGSAAIRSRTD